MGTDLIGQYVKTFIVIATHIETCNSLALGDFGIHILSLKMKGTDKL